MSQYQAVLELSSLDGTNGFEIVGEAAGDESGQSVSGAGDVNGDGYADLIIGACQADPNGNTSGASYVVFGKASGFVATLALSSLDGNNGFQISGETAEWLSGRPVSSAGDVNGDGFDDMLVAAVPANPNGYASGATYVVFGKASGFGAEMNLSSLDGNNGFQINGEAVNDHSGVSVSSAGDVNGDGFDDVLVGANFADPAGNYSGASYVVFGKASGFAATLELSSLNGTNGFQITGAAEGDLSGTSVSSAGDFNGDGVDDLIVGASLADPNALNSGASFVVFGKAALGAGGNLNLSSLDGTNGFRINGEAQQDYSGRSVSGAGDVNGDGFADLIVGALNADPNGTGSGASYVVFGTDAILGAALQLSSLDGDNGFQISGEAAADYSGYSVSEAGDFNGDGFGDLIVGAWGASPNGAASGASYVVFGAASGFDANLNLSSLDGNNGFQINGEAALHNSGRSVAGAGDVNGDGFDDLIVGAFHGGPPYSYAGASYVIFGSMPGEAVARSGTAIGNTIHGGDFSDALSGLNGDDTLIGHNGSDVMKGGGDDDTLDGGKGKDKLTGGTGADTIDGGSKADKFIYTAASNSSSTSYDTVVKFDFTQDRFDTPVAITAIDSAVGAGTLRTGHFDSDLASAVAGLGVNHAILFTASAGNLSGKTFLVVDQNGAAGYQAGSDLVIELKSPVNLASIDTGDFI